MTPDSLCSTLIRQNARAVGAMGGLYLHDVMQHARAVVGVWAESEETVADRIDNVGGQMLLLRPFSAAKQHSRHGRQFKDNLRLEMLPAVSRATRDREMEQKKKTAQTNTARWGLSTLYTKCIPIASSAVCNAVRAAVCCFQQQTAGLVRTKGRNERVSYIGNMVGVGERE